MIAAVKAMTTCTAPTDDFPDYVYGSGGCELNAKAGIVCVACVLDSQSP